MISKDYNIFKKCSRKYFFHWFNIFVAAYIFLIFLASSTPANSNSNSNSKDLKYLHLCDAMKVFLQSDQNIDPSQLETDGCIQMELLLIYSNSWPQTVSNFRHYVHPDGFPVLLFYSFENFKNGQFLESLKLADLAVKNAAAFFSRSDDAIRREVYVSLMLDWRESFVAPLVPSEDRISPFWVAIGRKYLKHLPDTHEPKELLKCLIISDPLIDNISLVTESPRFSRCLEGSL